MLGGNPISKACKQNICRHFHFIVVFLFPIKRKELTLTLCIIFAFFIQTTGKVAKETEARLQEREIS